MARKLKNENDTELIGSFVTEANIISGKLQRLSRAGADLKNLIDLHRRVIGMPSNFKKVTFSTIGYVDAIEVSNLSKDFREKLIALLVEGIREEIERLKKTIQDVALEMAAEFPKQVEKERGGGSGQPAA